MSPSFHLHKGNRINCCLFRSVRGIGQITDDLELFNSFAFLNVIPRNSHQEVLEFFYKAPNKGIVLYCIVFFVFIVLLGLYIIRLVLLF